MGETRLEIGNEGMWMGKTIKLKLTPIEKKFIKKLKDESDLKNKDVLRNALWFYVEHTKHPFVTTQENDLETESNISRNTPIQEYIAHLKDEIFFLREENQKIQDHNLKFQDHIEEEIKRLHEQYDHMIPFIESVKPRSEKELPSIVVTSIQDPDISKPITVDTEVLNEIDHVLEKNSSSSKKTEKVNVTKKSDLKQKEGLFQRFFSVMKIR